MKKTILILLLLGLIGLILTGPVWYFSYKGTSWILAELNGSPALKMGRVAEDKPPRGVFVIAVKGLSGVHSVSMAQVQLNKRFGWGFEYVVISDPGMSGEYQQAYRDAAAESPVHFQDWDFNFTPEGGMWEGAPAPNGYRRMVELFSGPVFDLPQTQHVDFLVRLDDDAPILSTHGLDIIRHMRMHGVFFGGAQQLIDPAHYTHEFEERVLWPYCNSTQRRQERCQRNMREHPSFFDANGRYTRLLVNTAIAFYYAPYFRSAEAQAFLQVLQDTRKQFYFRWGDHLVMTTMMLLATWEPKTRAHYYPEIQFTHKSPDIWTHEHVYLCGKRCLPGSGLECYSSVPLPVQIELFEVSDATQYLARYPVFRDNLMALNSTQIPSLRTQVLAPFNQLCQENIIFTSPESTRTLLQSLTESPPQTS